MPLGPRAFTIDAMPFLSTRQQRAALLILALGAALVIACAATAFELVPLRLDDNLTIPLFVGFTAWITCALSGIPLG